jgi:hypothetical protein
MNTFLTICAHLRAKNLLNAHQVHVHLSIAKNNEQYAINMQRFLDTKVSRGSIIEDQCYRIEKPEYVFSSYTQAIMAEVEAEMAEEMDEFMWT